MRDVEAEAFEHPTHGDGGFVVLVLRDATLPPSIARVSLRLLDADGSTALGRAHDAIPLSTAANEHGVSLVVERDSVPGVPEHPGALVEIVVPGPDIRGLVRWPEPRAAAVASIGRPIAGATYAPILKAPAIVGDANQAEIAGLAQVAAVLSRLPTGRPALNPDGGASLPGTEFDVPAQIELLPEGEQGYETGEDDRRLGKDNLRQSREPPSIPSSGRSSGRSPTGMTASVAPRRHPPAGIVFAATLATLLGLETLALVVLDLKIIPSSQLAEPLAVTGRAQMPAAADDARQLATPGMSPRGISAQGVPPPKALEQAYTSLGSTGGLRDPEEAEFWLKRYLATTFGSPNTRVVLTQLGSLYADTAREPADFGKARMAWELASALGDPVAMCFLGAIHSQGWGVAADIRIAAEWFRRASAAGNACQSARSIRVPSPARN